LVKSFYGLTYTPQRAQHPECGVSIGDVIEDLKVLSQLTTRLRLYGMDCNQANLLQDAIAQLNIDMSLVLTVWVDDNERTYARQLDALWDTLDRYQGEHVIGISVGNEALFRRDVTAAELAQRMRDVRVELKKRRINIPVYTTDLAENFDTTIMQASDAALGNIHPYFAKVSAADAAQWTWDYYRKTIAASGKTAIISETGWPTQGDSNGSAVPSTANLQAYLDSFLCQTIAKKIPCYFFEAFDAAWKAADKPVERSWGILTKDRRLKVRIPRCEGAAVHTSTPASAASTGNARTTRPAQVATS
ncbi:glycoside hydrolase superfamily, partial [Syncephalis pseudoplumigaleata]